MSSAAVSKQYPHTALHECTTSTRSPSAASPDYATLDFKSRGTTPNLAMGIAPPKRGVKPLKANLHSSQQHYLHQHRDNNNNHNNQKIYQNVGHAMLTSRQVMNHSDADEEELDERDRTFATAICIFSSVLTMVLVLMFYLVGEAAFRSILLILSFVFFITLFLACFLRRPSAIVFTNSSSHASVANPSPKAYHHPSHYASQKQPIFMLVPPNSATPEATVIPFGYCPVHSPRPESSVPEMILTPPPELPPKSPPIPTPPPIQTIPSRVINSRYSSSSSFSQDSLEIIDKIEEEKLQIH